MSFRPQADSSPQAVALVVYLWILGAAAAAVCLAGRPDQGGLGIFLIAGGAAMIVARPSKLPDRWLLLLFGLICGGSLLALLPQAWFGLPEWRHEMAQNGAIPLAASVSVMPSYTVFWAGVLAATGAIAIFLNGYPLSSRQLSWLALLAAFVTATYAALAIIAQATGWNVLPHGDATFGFFPNRNHTGAFLTMGALASMGLAFHHLSRAQYFRGSLACVCCLSTTGALLFYSESRAGVLTLGMGLAIWLIGTGRKYLGKRTLIVVGVLAAYGLFFFFFERSPARDRLLQMVDAPHLDFRLIVFQDALRLFAAYPVTGTGLGIFQYAFPHYQTGSVREARLLHPESDWLLILTEMGVIPLAAIGAAFVILVRRLWNQRTRGDWPLRWALASACMVALLHGLIDVPLHRVALGWFVMVLGLAAFTVRSPHERPRHLGWAWIFHALIGLGIGALGISMVRAEWFGGRSMPPFRGAYYDEQLRTLGQERRFDEAEQLAAAGIRELPMLDQLYYWRAGYLLTFSETDAEAARHFAAARLLDPNSPGVGQQEARLWMPIDAPRAADAWFDAVERGMRIDHSMGDSSLRSAVRFLGEALLETRQQPEIQLRLLEKSRDNPILLATWIRYANEDLARGVVAEFPKVADFFAVLPPSDRSEMLSQWIRLGNSTPAVNFMEAAQASAPPPGPYWKILSHYYAGKGSVEKAVRFAAKAMNIPFAVRWQTREADSFDLTPFERELRQAWQDQNDVAVRRMMAEAEETKDPDTASLRTIVAFYAVHGEWEKAWRVIARLE